MAADLSGFFRTRPFARETEPTARLGERSQALIRLFVAAANIAYVSVITSSYVPVGPIAAHHATAILIYLCVYILVALGILTAVIRRPGINHARRILSMCHDYSGMCLAMSLGGEAMLPVFASLLWVTVGNGLRFGPRYLLIATVMAIITLCITTVFSPYWQSNPFMVLTLIVTSLIVPVYIASLLRENRRVTEEAIEANIAKSRFLAQASHDLRQPIHAISLFTACLRDAGLQAEERQMVDNIDRSLQSVSRLFRSLLDISTLDSGKVVPLREPIALSDVFDEVIAQNAQAAEWANVTLHAVPSKLHVFADPTLLGTMLQNIVSNALKYAPGRPVLIGCRRRGGRIAIEVHDRGDGITAEHLPHLFEEFYQIRERGDKDVEGVGLGLSIVRRLARLMELDVSIRSKPGRGTSVVIDDLVVASPRIRRKDPARKSPLDQMKGLRVLLVEDDEDVLLATASLLEKWGCKVEAATAVPEAVPDCDMLITDFDLGAKTTGTDCILEVRAALGGDIPAIVMTGHDENRVRVDLDDETIPILAKPVRPSELRSTIFAQLIRTSRASELQSAAR
ncbi:ATP-binding response regulator [Rhizobium halophytocola]|uniref:histidine kinase n=1 Tax=Rhizobium halophytocola TaxID=735519 RepID=A0ABS4DV72_9HYPH|nr:hybrid sensor histidine kinase/response regulator [Rhizobium halophytocola]MBP1849529.1 signal transduction histidine kinase [Rhizobium halophytocola]